VETKAIRTIPAPLELKNDERNCPTPSSKEKSRVPPVKAFLTR
jgi:hypothetical protein